jgi:DNA-binding YbaB/EbfC family protein
MNPGMMKKLQKMQRDMVRAQKELEASTFYGSAGGGAVKVEFLGNKRMNTIEISPDVIEDKEDIEILQDLITVAVNDCITKIDDETQRVISQFTGGGIPGLF